MSSPQSVDSKHKRHRQGTARKLDLILGEELPEIKQTLREVLAILAEQHRQNGHDRADPR